MRTLLGSTVYVHPHPYLPTGRIFSPTKEGEDPRLFDGDHLRPEVRAFVLEQVGEDWDGPYPDWTEWATVYLAGGEASHWYGSGAAHGEGEAADDFDVLVTVDFDALKARHLQYVGQTPKQIAPQLTQHFRAGFDVRNERASIPGVAGTYGMTAFVNSVNSQDITELHPYAAYDISHDKWAVRPVETPADWSAASLPEWTWDALEGLLRYIDAIREMPEPLRTREGAHLFDDLHSDRTEAFGPEGEGVFDPANVIWKALDLHPSQPLEFLVGCKRRHGHEAAVRHVRREDSPEPEGIMVALVPPRSVVESLVVEGGETPDNIHLTLSFLGKVSQYRRKHLDDLVEVVRAWAELQHPLPCRTQGAGTFVNPGSHVLWASVDCPGLHRIQVSLEDFLRKHGYKPSEQHGFQPHLTLAYERHHVRFLPKITPTAWISSEVWVVVGGRWESVPLGD